MPDDLLALAHRQALEADRSVRAAALLRIARAESAGDVSRATQTLLEGLDQVRQLPHPNREYLLEEALLVAAAVAPALLAAIAIPHSGPHERFVEGRIVEVMLRHGHFDASIDYLLHCSDPAIFPFGYVVNVLHPLRSDAPDNAARRLTIIRRAVEIWRTTPSTPHNQQRHHFIRVLGHVWKELPPNEALAIVHDIVKQALAEPDTGAFAGYMHEIHFSSPRQHLLFEILHILHHLDPALAQSLVDSRSACDRRPPLPLPPGDYARGSRRGRRAQKSCRCNLLIWLHTRRRSPRIQCHRAGIWTRSPRCLP